jgi:hypothetical protein
VDDYELWRGVQWAARRWDGPADQREELASQAYVWALGRLRAGWMSGETHRSSSGRLRHLAIQAVRMATDHVPGGRRARSVSVDPLGPTVGGVVDPAPSALARLELRDEARAVVDAAEAHLGRERAFRLVALLAPALLSDRFAQDQRTAAVLDASARGKGAVACVLAPELPPALAANTLGRAATRDARRLARELRRAAA